MRFLVVVISAVLGIGLLASAAGPGSVARAQTASPAVASSNIDPILQAQMAATPQQLLPIIVEARSLNAPALTAATSTTTTSSTTATTSTAAPATAAVASASAAPPSPPPPTPPPPRINEQLAQRALALISQYGVPVGGLEIIDSAAGWANAAGITSISQDPQVVFIYADSTVHPAATASTPWQVPLSAAYPHAVNADRVWWQVGATGSGSTVAVLDSGIDTNIDLTQPTNRLLAAVNFGGDKGGMNDAGGHGTHVAGIVGGNGTASNGEYTGMAPGVNMLDVRVLSKNGNGRLSSVIRGIEWCLAHRLQYNIRLINLSLGAPARTSYRLSPLDAAVELAWMRGVAVVAAAGNNGPAAGNVDSPGDDPYVITVGATDDRGTATTDDDVLASFSSWGTPQDSTSKPDVVAPGRHIPSLRVPGSYLDSHYANRVVVARSGATYFQLSGTSMATPVVTGMAALILQGQPGLTPDKLKALAMSTTQGYGWAANPPAAPAPGADGSGLIDAWAATYGAPQSGDQAQSDPLRRRTLRPVRQFYRPADTAARTLYAAAFGVAPLNWKDPGYQGIGWSGLTWTNLAWDNLAWDNLAWDNLAWDNLAWDNLAWDNLAWDNLAWDNLAWDNLAWDSTGTRD